MESYYDHHYNSTSMGDVLLYIIFIVFSILQIILFFKLWGMTNDIREIKNKYLYPVLHEENDVVVEENTESSLDGKIVVNLATSKQMRVNGITDEGKFKCYTGQVYIGDFDQSEIMDFNLWVKKNKSKI